MITRIELDGVRTFQEFELQLAPSQVIGGSNGAGKSNPFDALRLLARLADADLRSAFQVLRGEAGELFMALPDGQPVDHLRLLALVTLKNDLQHRGVLCFEDPENGVHPFHLTLYTPTQQRSPATFALRP
ncbi:MAG: hypothetical protein MUC51_10095 [Anaerolineae bacterium]|nr:hypothetical protein [Anaerolineae bacterium]